MEASRAILPAGLDRLPRSHRNHRRNRTSLLQTRDIRLLSLRLLPIRPLRFLLDLRHLLCPRLALLPLALGLYPPPLGDWGYGDRSYCILRERYASGEITEDQYDQMMRDLQQHNQPV